MTLFKSPVQLLLILCFVLLSRLALGQPALDNSNFWPVYRDTKVGFHISYPTGWIIIPGKGPNVKFSVNPPIGAGNCNVVARPNAELNGMTQAALNREIESMPADQASWADYLGLPSSKVHVIGFRRATIFDVPALMGIVETELENLAGKFTRKQIVAITFTPGIVWSLNCGASTGQADEARARFKDLEPTFYKVFGSFGFLK